MTTPNETVTDNTKTLYNALDRITELAVINARLTAQVAAADGCAESLREFVNYQGGADHATDDEYVMERAQDTLTDYDNIRKG